MSTLLAKVFLLLVLVSLLGLSLWTPGWELFKRLSVGILLGLGALSLVTAAVVLWESDWTLHALLVGGLLGIFSVYAVSVAKGQR